MKILSFVPLWSPSLSKPLKPLPYCLRRTSEIPAQLPWQQVQIWILLMCTDRKFPRISLHVRDCETVTDSESSQLGHLVVSATAGSVFTGVCQRQVTCTLLRTRQCCSSPPKPNNILKEIMHASHRQHFHFLINPSGTASLFTQLTWCNLAMMVHVSWRWVCCWIHLPWGCYCRRKIGPTSLNNDGLGDL